MSWIWPGRTLRTMTGFDNQSLVKVPVNDFAPGLYIIQLHSGDAVIVKKIVVAK
jgi:fibronectin type 3 domain-containing protein